MKIIACCIDKIWVGAQIVRGRSSCTRINTFWVSNVVSDFSPRPTIEEVNIPSWIIIGRVVIGLAVNTRIPYLNAIYLIAIDDIVANDGTVSATGGDPAAANIAVASRVVTASRDHVAINNIIVSELRRCRPLVNAILADVIEGVTSDDII